MAHNTRSTLGHQLVKKLNLAAFKDKRDGSDRFICLSKKRTGFISNIDSQANVGQMLTIDPLPATEVHLEEKHVRN